MMKKEKRRACSEIIAAPYFYAKRTGEIFTGSANGGIMKRSGASVDDSDLSSANAFCLLLKRVFYHCNELLRNWRKVSRAGSGRGCREVREQAMIVMYVMNAFRRPCSAAQRIQSIGEVGQNVEALRTYNSAKSNL